MYSAFYLARLNEDHVLPYWWLDYEDEVIFYPKFLLNLSVKANAVLKVELSITQTAIS